MDPMGIVVLMEDTAPIDMVNITSFTGYYTSQVVVWDFWTINSTWMSQEVSKWLGSMGYNPNIPHL